MKLDDVKKLHQKKYRQTLGYCLVEGEHLILELIKAIVGNPALAQTVLYVTEQYAQWQSALATRIISDKQMAAIATTQHPQGILAVVPLSALSHQPKERRAIYLHEVQDPGNLGTILRSLAWFGGFQCLLSPGSVDPFNPKVIRASMGAIFHVPLIQEIMLSEVLQKFSHLAVVDMQGEPIAHPAFQKHDCYLFGNEARGIPQDALAELHLKTYHIPGAAQIDSLNLASAVNICLYELSR